MTAVATPNKMSKLDDAVQDPIPLSQVLGTHSLSIDFQLPAILCYCTLAVQAIFTKTDLIASVNRILASQPYLVKPGGTVVNNWKLTDLRGEIIDVRNWTAMEHTGATIMVSFDSEYLNGALHSTQWQTGEPEYNSDLLIRGDLGSVADFPMLLPCHSIVRANLYHRSKKRKMWKCMSRQTYFIPNRLKLGILATALFSSSNVEIRYRLKDPSNATDFEEWGSDTSYTYCDPSQTIGEVEGENDIKEFDVLIK